MKLSGPLLVGGFLLNFVSTMFHPTGAENDHESIFTEYANSDPWVIVHVGQFIGVLLALGGVLVLCRALRPGGPHLAILAAGATIATAATWAVLQGLDGVALKQAVDAWVDATGTDEATRFAAAETVRWLEWGFQSYFRLLFGLSLLLLGPALLLSRMIARWLGWTAIAAGLLSVAIGLDVGYSGLESGFQDAASLIFLLVVLVFAIGVLETGLRRRDRLATARA